MGLIKTQECGVGNKRDGNKHDDGDSFCSSNRSSKARTCCSVRGKPSKTQPLAQSSWASRSIT
eukprot:482911-Rhodomonas_salina.2